jgi:twitching motility protein PilT
VGVASSHTPARGIQVPSKTRNTGDITAVMANPFAEDVPAAVAPTPPPPRPAAPEPPPPAAVVPAAVAPAAVGFAPSPPPSAPLEALMHAARQAKASDLHVVATRPSQLRLAGELVPTGEPISAEAAEAMLLPIIPGRLRATYDTHGSVDFALQSPRLGRFRVNISRMAKGMKGCFRLISSEVPTLEALGLPAAIANATHHHQGLIVVTGPTGHGKTTTLSAIVNLINSNTTHHVITIEDPVEQIHPRKKAMMSQREVGTTTRSFQSALKGSLREDPDVIVIGELRDTETVRIALSASETGHLVIGTMNTPSAAKTIDRLIDLFPPGDQAQVRLTLSGGLKLVLSQRLVPNSDRTGLVAACEVLPGSIPLWNLIRDNKTYQITSLQQRGKAMGIVRLDDSLADLVKSGRTVKEHVMPFAESANELESRITGRPVSPQPAEATNELPGAAAAAAAGKAAAAMLGNVFKKKG